MKSVRIKTGTMMFPEIIKLCDNNLKLANVKSRNDFIEEAIKFYVSYLHTEKNTMFLNETIESVIRASIQITEDRISRLLFKLTVEMSMMMNIIGANFGIDEATLKKLRVKCINDIKSTIGSLNLEEVMKYQDEVNNDG